MDDRPNPARHKACGQHGQRSGVSVLEAATGSFLLLVSAGLAAGALIHAGAVRYARQAQADDDRAETGLVPLLLMVLAGAVNAGLAAAFSLEGWPWLTALFGWLLLALAAIDLRTFLLPDRLNLAVLALGAAMVAGIKPDDWMRHVAGGVIGFGLLWGMETAYRHLRGREGLGRGDAKLLGAIGVWVGATGVPPVLLIASLSGILAALVTAWRTGTPLNGSAAIAFGPWIALGGYAVWIMQMAGLL